MKVVFDETARVGPGALIIQTKTKSDNRSEQAMFRIGRPFHVVHMSDDFDEIDRWYEDVFSVNRWMKGYSSRDKRYASLVCVSDFVFEPMAPAKEPGAEELPVGRFHARFGRHLHSIAWYVTDIRDLYDRLKEQGIRLYTDGGGDITAGYTQGSVFTHPRDTHCQWQFIEPGPEGPKGDPRLREDWSDEQWREHPLGIERASHITVGVHDVGKATTTFCEGLNGRLVHQETDRANQTSSAYIAVGEDTIVEVAQPLSSDSLLGKDVAKNGEIVHAVTFKVKDANAAKKYLKRLFVRTEDREAGFVIRPEDAFGAVIGFTERAIPNDPRE